MGRVYLRKPEEGDVHEYVAAVKTSVALHRPWVYPDGTEAGYRTYLDRIQNGRHAGYFVCRSNDERIIGMVNLSEIVRGALCSAYVGYWAVANRSGGGMMTEGVRQAINQAFGPLDLHRLEVNVQPANKRSIAIVKRLGLRKEGFSPRYLKIGGEWRDHERWAVTREEWSIR